jgi:hypothetical protein
MNGSTGDLLKMLWPAEFATSREELYSRPQRFSIPDSGGLFSLGFSRCAIGRVTCGVKGFVAYDLHDIMLASLCYRPTGKFLW